MDEIHYVLQILTGSFLSFSEKSPLVTIICYLIIPRAMLCENYINIPAILFVNKSPNFRSIKQQQQNYHQTKAGNKHCSTSSFIPENNVSEGNLDWV